MHEVLSAAVLWGQQHVIVAPLLYIGFVIIGAVLFVPGSLVMMIAGFVFGFGPGTLLAAIAIPLGSQSAFVIGRRLVRSSIEHKISQQPRLQAIESALQERSFLIVALTRVSLLVPFNLLNYFYGATSVKSRTHFVATAFGMFPAVALYVYLGSVAKNVQEVLSGDATPSQLGVWLVVAGLIVIGVITWLVHRTATQALQQYMPNEQNREPGAYD